MTTLEHGRAKRSVEPSSRRAGEIIFIKKKRSLAEHVTVVKEMRGESFSLVVYDRQAAVTYRCAAPRDVCPPQRVTPLGGIIPSCQFNATRAPLTQCGCLPREAVSTLVSHTCPRRYRRADTKGLARAAQFVIALGNGGEHR